MNDSTSAPAHKVTIVLGTFVLGGVVAAALWNWWSARCGDDCATPRIVHMLVFLALLLAAVIAGALVAR